MAGLPRRIIKVTTRARLRLPALLLPSRRTGRSGPSLPPARGPRWEARGSAERVWPRRRGKSGAEEGAPGRLPAAVGQPGSGDRGLPGGRPASGEGLARALAEGGAAGLRGSGLGSGPPRPLRPPQAEAAGARESRRGPDSRRGLWTDTAPRPRIRVSARAGAQGCGSRRFRMNEPGGRGRAGPCATGGGSGRAAHPAAAGTCSPLAAGVRGTWGLRAPPPSLPRSPLL